MMRAVVVCALLLSACRDSALVFHCHGNGECAEDAVVGRCETTGWCSLPSLACPSASRYVAESGDDLGGVCVPPDLGLACEKPTPGTIYCDHFDNAGFPAGWPYPAMIVNNSPTGDMPTTITDTASEAEDGSRSLEPNLQPPSASAYISHLFAPPLPTTSLYVRAWINIPASVAAAVELVRLRTSDGKAVWLGWTPGAPGNPALQIFTTNTTASPVAFASPAAGKWTCVKLQLSSSTALAVTVGTNAPRTIAIESFSSPFDTLILGQVSLVDIKSETSTYIDNLVVSSDDPGC